MPSGGEPVMIQKTEFIEMFRQVVREETENQFAFRIGTIATTSGKPTIRFAGETEPSAKGYSYLSSYTPAVGDRVLLARVKGTYVILGKLEG